ncbi:phosphopantetheine-binding protein [Catalinimonas niigatensis]|uniref:phosphopantetheine-binding protein n=1 Tax=Catalinimonas niigatensis TaxID=1397264 RepID=UPI002665E9F7|nr:phosphopantetheine-binding protein [Catalinimonas niigatensis]WPP52592.1 phosphopantetheine-binding protein [Catalinimonas niigatensis]
MSKSQPEKSLLYKVREILEKVKPERSSGLAEITSHLSKDLGLDSLDIVEFVLLLEWNFKISISDHEAENLSTVAQAIELVQMKRRED